MGRGSRSFLRYRKNAAFLGEVLYVQTENKKNIIDYMHRFEYNDRAVYFAENLQTMTQDQIHAHLMEISQRLHEYGTNGVVEFHPTADGTSKSAHIHYWGALDGETESIIIDFIKQKRLSNKTYLNYTNEQMREETEHKIVKENLVEYSFDRKGKEVTRETIKKTKLDEDRIAIQNAGKSEKSYDDIISFCDEILEQMEIEWIAQVQDSIDFNFTIDMDKINQYIMEMQYELYE